MNKWIVITSINPPGESIRALAKLRSSGWSILVVGDARSPADWHCEGVEFLPLEEQERLYGPLATQIPRGHYSRKNLGYLHALEHGAELILETDDDNIPYCTFGTDLARRVPGRSLNGPGWVNVYKQFTHVNIWPRGLPLDALHNSGTVGSRQVVAECPVQQFLVDDDPDVDAIHRLVFKEPISFDRRQGPVVLEPGTWSPFNSQNTLFFAEAFCLMYLPCFATFRMTDIWRSFVAQASLAFHRKAFSFHPSTARQVRNAHNLMADFESEVVGYLHNRPIMDAINEGIASQCTARSSLAETAWQGWRALVQQGYLPEKEQTILDRWLARMSQRTLAEAA